MQQEDYILREIEKIGLMMLYIRQKLFGGTDNLATSPERQQTGLSEMLLDEAQFDVSYFLSCDESDAQNYMNRFPGFNADNRELLADCLAEIGFSAGLNAPKYLAKALYLYQSCNALTQVFSFAIDDKIRKVSDLLRQVLGKP